MADLKTPVGDAPVLPLILMGAGGLILWFGVHYWRDATVKSPATVLKSTLQGKGIPAKSASPTVQADLTAAITPGGAGQAAAGEGGPPGGTPLARAGTSRRSRRRTSATPTCTAGRPAGTARTRGTAVRWNTT